MADSIDEKASGMDHKEDLQPSYQSAVARGHGIEGWSN